MMTKLIGRSLLLAAFLFGTVVYIEPARAGLPYPGCLNSEKRPAPESESIAWWERRSAREQELMTALSCKERYIGAVCVFLGYYDTDPRLVTCINKRLANVRSDEHCMATGHELLTEEMAACKDKFKKTYKAPF